MGTRAEVLVSISEIADLASVGRPAVSNWRKRHADFPAPRVQAAAGALFSLDEVERWLIEQEKIDGPIPPARIVRQLADAARGSIPPGDWSRFLTACLVYLEACRRAAEGSAEVSVPPHHRWDAIREAEARRLQDQLIGAASAIEKSTPTLRGLLLTSLDQVPPPEPERLRGLLDTLRAAADEEWGGYVDLFEDLVAREPGDQARGQHTTPDSIAQLVVELAPPADTIVDLACGEGGLLLLAALHRDVSETPALTGYEIDEDVHRAARSRFFLYDVPADLRRADVLRVPADELPKADLVVMNPPFGLSKWGDAAIYQAEQWQFGNPSPSSAEFAWPQLAIWCLRPGGTAIVVMPPSAAFRGARDAAIRSALLDAGVIEAVIALPSRVFLSTAIAPHIWILRADRRPDEAVLMVNASRLGEASRSQTLLDQSDIDKVVEVVLTWRNLRTIDAAAPLFARAVERSEITEGDLTPGRYDPGPEIDLDALRHRATELRRSIEGLSSTAFAALNGVLHADPTH